MNARRRLNLYIYGIYKNNQLVYIGQTKNCVKKRFQKHCSDARLSRNLCMNIVKAIKKYGSNNFTYDIIATTNTQQELCALEFSLIQQFKPKYNIAIGGFLGLGHSVDTRNKISEIQKKKIECTTDGISFKSVIDAETFYGAAKGTIGRVARGVRRAYNDKEFKFINNNRL